VKLQARPFLAATTRIVRENLVVFIDLFVQSSVSESYVRLAPNCDSNHPELIPSSMSGSNMHRVVPCEMCLEAGFDHKLCIRDSSAAS
jgi:hypothetical protein